MGCEGNFFRYSSLEHVDNKIELTLSLSLSLSI